MIQLGDKEVKNIYLGNTKISKVYKGEDLIYPSGQINYEYIDLGLSVKWATCNIGATKLEEYGWYFQWGDTQGWRQDQIGTEKQFTWATYKWCNGTQNTLTKYCTDADYGIVDNKTTLDLEDDSARANMGGKWRMPSQTEYQELINACNYQWQINYNSSGVNGMLFTLKTDTTKKLFFPATGYYYYSNGTLLNNIGYIWINELYTALNDTEYGKVYLVQEDLASPIFRQYKCCGLPVRGVFS